MANYTKNLKKTLSPIRLDAGLHEMLEAGATTEEISVSDFVRRAIEEKCNRLGIYLHDDGPGAITLDEREAHFIELAESERLGWRLAAIHAAVFAPASILDYVLPASGPTYLSECLTSGVPLPNNTALYGIIALVESLRHGSEFTGRPPNTIAAYIRSRFEVKGWTYPTHPLAWRVEFFGDSEILVQTSEAGTP